ncbi:hypothetical protein RAZWK3B_08526 [Roseobacter sp. AzwK-3b]|uniref:hypothetical protein n=1 Tax=Roseobacter sp. AzwK-3b TaxID=351016 RepID=UPI00015691DC|nr:hypothetical protein [Roseobacter sp. AzwK-3b]EDM72281.1 hypothetical protein RAZWK3B_08526 [Roseobacter sp. AzwK-3b]
MNYVTHVIPAALLATAIFASTKAFAEYRQPNWFFVQTAKSIEIQGNKLVVPVKRDVFAFTSRPKRKHGYLTAGQFVALWKDGKANFTDTPPNAVLTWADVDRVHEAEIVLTGAHMGPSAAAVIFEFEFVVGAALPETARSISLFVDGSSRFLDQ